MKIKLFNIVLALAIAVMVWYVLTKRKATPECSDFKHLTQVAVVDGDKAGAMGIVLRVSRDEGGECLYLVRGQLGTEMPFMEWYTARELFDATGM